ncbi:MAG TPA: UDP-N-acetylglucosamine 2-epimerase (non-hydrolyzing) [Saprospiraceae bacterium]|nr:UDP-N-acetylglucosamine 2-epimerase (non-hydrolyzing) [Saprospiraceae bacterium]HNT19436.1 UDP-N-acetylglucosamine 2-epimerase (non-hydrolyzing) [Saprospiraceae bacterium]
MIATILGARPQFIKAAVVSAELKKLGIEEYIIHTGQHYDANMSEVFWKELELPSPAINLNVGSASPGKQIALMLERLEAYLMPFLDKIRLVLVYGDTNSTLAGALAAANLGIPVAHIEAGLRSFDKTMPEEINRVLTDHLSRIFFCSSAQGVKWLKREGIDDQVYEVGDVMADALTRYLPLAEEKIRLENILPFDAGEQFILLTIHRQSNTMSKDRLASLIEAVGTLGMRVFWPVHPRSQQALKDLKLPNNIHLAGPLSYLEMLKVLNHSYKLITDSGGLQKEAYWLKKPCITLRTETEWVETLENKWNRLAPDTESLRSVFGHGPEAGSWKPLYTYAEPASKAIARILGEIYG